MRELPILTRTVQTENCQLTLQYAVLVEETPDELEHYGVKITEESTSSSVSVSYVTISTPKIFCLIEILANGTVTPVGLMDVIADWL